MELMKSATPELRLRDWRKAIGLSQKELARAAGVSQAYVSAVENGLSQIGGQLKTFLEAVNRRHNRLFRIYFFGSIEK